MPLDANIATQITLARLKAVKIDGFQTISLATAVGNALVQHLRSLRVITTATGLLGVGQGSGKANLQAAPGISIMRASLNGAGINGVMSSPLGAAVAQATADIVSTGIVQTTVPNVASGIGVGGFGSTNASLLVSTLRSALRGVGSNGFMVDAFASGLGNGIASHLQSVAIQTTIIGAPSTPSGPSTGIGSGSLQ